MAGEKEADRVVFALQPLGRQPRLDLRQRDRLALAAAAEQFALPDGGRVVRALGAAEHGIDGGKDAGAVWLERVEGAGGGQAFQHALVDRARIDARGEIGEIGELGRSPRAAMIASTACLPTPLSAASA